VTANRSIELNANNICREEDKDLLRSFLHSQQIDHQFYLEKDKPYKFIYKNTAMEITLSSPIVMWEVENPESSRSEWRYGVCGQVLGRGAFGTVYAIDKKFYFDDENNITLGKKKRVVKVQRFFIKGGKEIQDEIERESEICMFIPSLSAKQAKTVKNIMNIGSEQIATQVMRLYTGTTLESALKTEKIKNLTDLQRTQICINLLREMHQLHLLGIVHRDIKPGNIIIDPDTLEVHFIDLGLAEKKEKTSYKFIGTKNYLAPEVSKTRPITTKTDIYSLGLTLAEVWGASFRKTPLYMDDDKYVFEPLRLFLNLQNNPYSDQIVNMLKIMSSVESDARPTAEQGIVEFEKLKFMLEHQITDEVFSANDEKWIAIQIGLNVHLRIMELNERKIDKNDDIDSKINEIKIIVNEELSKIKDDPKLIKQFCVASQINAFLGLSSSNEIMNVTKSILSEFESNMKSIHLMSKNIKSKMNDFRLERNTNKNEYKELKKLDSDLDKMFHKYSNAMFTLDGIDVVNKKYALKDFQKRHNHLDYRRTSRIVSDKQYALKELEDKLIHAKYILENKKDHLPTEFEKLKLRLIEAIQNYIKERFNDISSFDDSILVTRINDVENVFDAINKNNDVKNLSNEFKQKFTDMKVGFFNRSKLRDDLTEIIRNFEQSENKNQI